MLLCSSVCVWCSCLYVTRFSLVHGDAHPHNALWVNQRTDEAKLVLIDFEMVGVGSPAQELGQYMISHMEPETRRACEDQVVRAYHEELLRMIKPTTQDQDKGGETAATEPYTFEACWAEYIAGGIGRWVWFIPLFRGSVLQYSMKCTIRISVPILNILCVSKSCYNHSHCSVHTASNILTHNMAFLFYFYCKSIGQTTGNGTIFPRSTGRVP